MTANPANIAIVCVLAASFGLWCFWGYHFWCRGGRFPQIPDHAVTPPWNVLAAAVAGYLTLSSLSSKLMTAGQPRAALTVADLRNAGVMQASLFLLLLLILKFADKQSTRRPWEDYGIHHREPLRQVRCGILGFLAAILPVVILLQVTSSWRTEQNQHAFIQTLRDNPNAEVMTWVAVTVVVVAPLAEELHYRVVLQSAFRQCLPPLPAVLCTALLFCGVHGWPDALPLLPLALVLGTMYSLTRSYVAIAVTHAAFNAWNLGWFLLIG